MTTETNEPAAPASAPVVASAAAGSWFGAFARSGAGKLALAGAAVLAIGVGVAGAQGWRNRHEPGMGMGPMGGGRMVERFCSADLPYVTQRIADRLAARLTLTDAQKPALAELRKSAVDAGATAKAICNDKPDMATAPGRLAATQQRLMATATMMAAIKPKLDAFYATLDANQKADFDRMGPGRGPRHHGDGPRERRRGDGRDAFPGDMRQPG